MATEEEINRVIESTDMVSLVSPYVKLIKNGNSYKGLCPFHSEKTPSFVVSQEKHLAHCFGCGGGGNPIKFLMQIENISFNEALVRLAKKNGVKVNVKVNNNQPNYQKYYDMMDLVTKFYQQNLTMTKSGQLALEYLKKRGLDDEVIKTFRIGLAPQQFDSLYQVLKDSNYLELDMLDLGLINKREDGYTDLFIKRKVFPITHENANVIGFSARIYDNNDPNQPKYINTKETFLYHKGNVLYNLANAKGEILKNKRVVLHEGQMDVIASYSAGLKEVICTMGTALTDSQAAIIKKYTNNVVICYDADKAGIKASLKAINIFKKVGIEPSLVLLPKGFDPDEYLKKYGKEKYLEYFNSNIIDQYQYQFEVMFIDKNLNDSVIIEKTKYEAFSVIANLKSQTLVDKFLQELAKKLNLNKSAISLDYQKYMQTNQFDFNEQNQYQKDIFEETNIAKPINNLFKPYELRLFIYARTSKNTALDIDSKLDEAIDAFSPINRDIWITLINDYYAKFAEFNDNQFLTLLTESQKSIYLENLQKIHNDNNPYNMEDLDAIIKKMKNDFLNQKILLVNQKINNTNDDLKKIEFLNEKFNKIKLKQKTRGK